MANFRFKSAKTIKGLKMKKFFVLLIVMNALLWGMSDKELAVTINLAGKQRMLTQKMSKEAMLIKLNINPQENRKNLKKSSSLFDKTLKGLMYGDKELGLVPTNNKNIQAKLNEIKYLWNLFYAKIKNIYNKKDLTNKTFEYIEKNNIPLLKKMNEAVFMYAKIGNIGNNKLKLANDINLAGRQRMLTQKIAKDLLFYQANLNAKTALKDFEYSINLFDKTLNGLFYGDKKLKLVGTKLPKIVKQLNIVKKHWQECKPLIKKAIKNNNNLELTKKAIRCLDITKDEMNKAVVLYTLSLNRQKQVIKLNALIDSFLNKKKSAKYTINLAGKQRMLTQRISKLSIECKLGLIKDSCMKLKKYVKKYQKTLIGFLKGDQELRLKPTTSKKVAKQIKIIIKRWKPFAKAALSVQKSLGKDEKAVKYIIHHNEKLLQQSDKLVSLFVKENSKNISYIEKAQLNIVNIAGRQRMLTQKMTKELLAKLYLKMKDFEPKLKKSVKLFNNSLNGLIYGSKKMSLPKVTNKNIKEQLLKVSNIWKKVKPFYARKSLNKKELILLLKANPILLKEMDKAVKLIEISTDY